MHIKDLMKYIKKHIAVVQETKFIGINSETYFACFSESFATFYMIKYNFAKVIRKINS